jgi:hypothetical protein
MNRHFFASLFLLLCGSMASLAQVGIQDVAITPRPNPYVTTWGKLGDSLRVRVYNSDSVNQSIKLSIAIVKQDTLIADTDPAMAPDLLVAPGTAVFYAEQLVWPDAVRQHRLYLRRMLRSGRLLPGEYQLCVGGYEQLGMYKGGVCRPFVIEPWPALQLLGPATGDTVSLPVTLRWNTIALYPEDRITYKIRIVPLLSGQIPSSAFSSNEAVLEIGVTDATEYLWDGRAFRGAEPSCVWSVQALDEDGNVIGYGWADPRVMVLRGIAGAQ